MIPQNRNYVWQWIKSHEYYKAAFYTVIFAVIAAALISLKGGLLTFIFTVAIIGMLLFVVVKSAKKKMDGRIYQVK